MSIKPPHVLKILFLSLTSLFFLSACSSVSFQDKKTGEAVGFEYFPAKPYLVISESENGERSVKLISLPDVSRPHEVKHEGGWGTLDFNFKVSDGMIVSFGQTVDSKGPETIDAVSGGLTSIFSGLGLSVGAMAGQTLYNKKIQDLAEELRVDVIDPLYEIQNPALGKIAKALKKTRGKLLEAAGIVITVDEKPLDIVESNRKVLTEILEELEKSLRRLTVFTNNLKNENPSMQVALDAKFQLEYIIKKLILFTAVIPENLQIYEIVPKGDGKISFEPVILP